VKVANRFNAGRKAGITALSVIATTVAVLAGTGEVPPRVASAHAAEGSYALAASATDLLPPVVEEPKAEELRAPSGLEAVDAKASARRTPTVVARQTAARTRRASSGRAAPRGWQSARVSWYGPGFYGHTMAGGGALTRTSMVVAHRSLPFGTRIQFSYKGRTCVAVVRDRGPFVAGRLFDLGPGTAKALGFSGVGTVKYRILSR